jgi:solute:Na+ symporter, SSS family
MNLTPLDWTVIAVYFLFNLGIGLYYARRARGSTSEFFLSGRDVPWWLAGTSMVATTFAADTPLAVTGMVANNGIAGNWLWWNFVMSGMMTVFFYARLWRRAGVMTDIEFAELRYSGRLPAGLPRALPRHSHQLHHSGLGQPGDDQDSERDAAIRSTCHGHRLGRVPR